MFGRGLLPLLLLLLVLPFAFPSPVGDLYSSPYLPIFPLTLIIVAMLLIGIRMAATSFSMPQLEAWTKVEIRELIGAALLFIIAVAFLEAANQFTGVVLSALNKNVPVAYAGDNKYFNYANNIASSMITKASNGYQDGVIAISRLHETSTFGISSSAGFILYAGYGYTRYGGLYPLTKALQAGLTGLSNTIFLYQAIIILLDFFKYMGVSILFPIAFSFRAIPFTRQMGNTLIAMCLGVYLFFPLSIIMTDIVHSAVIGSNSVTHIGTDASCPKTTGNGVPEPHIKSFAALSPPISISKMVFGALCKYKVVRILLSSTEIPFAAGLALACAPFGGYFACFYALIWVYQAIQLAFSSGLGIAIVGMDSAIADFDVSAASNVVYCFLRDVNNLVLISYVDAILIGLVTVTSIRAISAAIGGESYIAGLERLI